MRLAQSADYESGGQEFESLRARQQPSEIRTGFLLAFLTVDKLSDLGSTGATPRFKVSAYLSSDRLGNFDRHL